MFATPQVAQIVRSSCNQHCDVLDLVLLCSRSVEKERPLTRVIVDMSVHVCLITFVSSLRKNCRPAEAEDSKIQFEARYAIRATLLQTGSGAAPVHGRLPFIPDEQL